MDILKDADARRRLEAYVDSIGQLLGRKARRESFAIYAMGLLGDGERKSIEPIAARACAEPAEVPAMEARLGHFLNDSPWSDERVRAYSGETALAAITAKEPVLNWIVDDTGMLKQGAHSVGVQRQYTGSAGKTTNCQVAVSLSVATRSAHVPLDFELYLPECWTEDPARRKEARIPDEVVFQTKLELALRMIRRAKANGVPPGVVLVDAAYGNANWFRMELRSLGLDYALAVQSPTKVWMLDRLERTRGDAIAVSDLAAKLVAKNAFRRCTWRAGTREHLSARFAAVRVACAYNDPMIEPRVREAHWLVIEWPDSEDGPTKFHLSSLPGTLTRRQLVRAIKERYRTERIYEDLKGELGFDHFEGRRFPGWHHHVTVALCCYHFIAAELARRFPPSAGRRDRDNALGVAA
jgi:SRSO17 transposase